MMHSNRAVLTHIAPSYRAALITTISLILLTLAPSSFAQWNPATTPGYIYYGGGVGIGTASPSASYLLDVNSTLGGRFYTDTPIGFGGLTVQGNGTAYGSLLTLGSGRGDVYAGVPAANMSVFITAGAASNGFIIETYNNRPLIFGTNDIERFRLDAVGNATVTGNLTATGNLAAKYQDVAEWVPSECPLDAGTVVVLSTEHADHVAESATAYDTKVAGVVSARPGLLLGEPGADKSKIAATGRVKIKVDATKHPIRIGDLLVTSDMPGHAMYSEPLEVAGVRMHRPGTIIGKALEPLPSGQGEVLVLLTLQ
jgi:hypothetical protein